MYITYWKATANSNILSCYLNEQSKQTEGIQKAQILKAE